MRLRNSYVPMANGMTPAAKPTQTSKPGSDGENRAAVPSPALLAASARAAAGPAGGVCVWVRVWMWPCQ